MASKFIDSPHLRLDKDLKETFSPGCSCDECVGYWRSSQPHSFFHLQALIGRGILTFVRNKLETVWK